MRLGGDCRNGVRRTDGGCGRWQGRSLLLLRDILGGNELAYDLLVGRWGGVMGKSLL